MKNILFALSAMCMFSFVACKKEEKAPSNSARVMFVNGCAGTDKVNVTSNGNTIQAATNLAFLKQSGYQYVAAGSSNITFMLANLGTPLKAGSTSFTAGTSYSVFAGGLITNPSIVFTTDDLAAPASGKAKIRFVNLSMDTLSETASANTTTFATGITSQSYSSFAEVAAGSYTIKAGDPADISTVVSTPSMQLDAGKCYTVILTGTMLGTGSSALVLTVITNN